VLRTRLDRKFALGEVVGSSAALQRSIEQVRSVAPSNATVLLLGETGTGKELFAQMIHQASQRAKGPFMAVHCAAIPANLLESELFGHEKGAFTGATERRVGRFESADGGTLFLDEIGEIDATTQVKLLRFLETRAVERLGSHRPIGLDLRLVCATNRDLLQMVKEGKFREDLYYRLSVVPLRLPALRERTDDIPLLLAHYLRRFAQENGVPEARLSPEALAVLTRYEWPGNIRELRNASENPRRPARRQGRPARGPRPALHRAHRPRRGRVRRPRVPRQGRQRKAAPPPGAAFGRRQPHARGRVDGHLAPDVAPQTPPVARARGRSLRPHDPAVRLVLLRRLPRRGRHLPAPTSSRRRC